MCLNVTTDLTTALLKHKVSGYLLHITHKFNVSVVCKNVPNPTFVLLGELMFWFHKRKDFKQGDSLVGLTNAHLVDLLQEAF